MRLLFAHRGGFSVAYEHALLHLMLHEESLWCKVRLCKGDVIDYVFAFIHRDAFREFRSFSHSTPKRFLLDSIGESQERRRQNVVGHRIYDLLQGYEWSRMLVFFD